MDNMKQQLVETTIHKKHVLDSCLLIAIHLMEAGNEELALALMERAATHDISKFEKEEFELLSAIVKERESFVDPNQTMPENIRKHVESHWRKNPHHPEYYEELSQMTELDIIEMVCDWHARGVQNNTDLLEFVTIRQKNRFAFPDEMFRTIFNYCILIDKLSKNDIIQQN